MILLCDDSVFFPDHADSFVGNDRIMERQNHDEISPITLWRCDLAEIFVS